MTAAEWKAKGREAAEVVGLELPSGMVIQARRPGPMQIAVCERLPLMLTVMFDKGAAAGMSADDARETNEFLHKMLRFACVEPSIGPGADQVMPEDIPDEDLTFLVSWVMRLKEAEELLPFRRVGADGGRDGDGEAVLLSTVVADGDRGPGAGAGVRPGGDEAGGRPESR